MLALTALMLLPGRPGFAQTPTILQLDVEGTIDPAVDDYIEEGIAHAAEIGAEAVLVRLDTPGGLVETTRSIVQQELNAPVPILVWVAPEGARAGSAGVFITLAAHVAAMAPGTNIGAATPIQLGAPTGDGEPGGGGDGTGQMGNAEAMRAKALQDTRAFARAIAETRGRPVDWLERTVTEAASSTSREALEAGAIDLIAATRAQLLDDLDGRVVDVRGIARTLNTRGANVEVFEMRFGQQLLHILAHPIVAQLLLVLGLLAIYFELSQPGGYIAGALGVVALILAIMSFQILPFDTGGLLLILLGIALLGAEAFAAAHGLLAVGGLISLVVGSLLLFDTPELTVRPSPWFSAGLAAVAGTLVVLIGLLVLRSRSRPTEVGAEAMVGLLGDVLDALDPSGTIRVRGELWTAELQNGGRLEAGARVEVTAIDGLRLTVNPIDPEAPPDRPVSGEA